MILRPIGNQLGISLVSIVLMLLMMGTIGAGLFSMTNTESFSVMGQDSGLKALELAEGGIEYALMFVPPAAFPNYSLPAFSTRGGTPNVPLGDGAFVVDSPTVLSSAVPAGGLIPVASSGTPPPICFTYDATVCFAVPGRILIDQEQIDYAGIGSLPADCVPFAAPCFTGVTRGVGGTVAAPHAVDASVYPVTTLSPPGIDGVVANIPVASSTGFIIPGVIKVEAGAPEEYVFCTGTTPISFTGCRRGYGGAGAPPATPHAAGVSVYQYVVTATGTVPTPIFGTASRMVRVTVDN